MSTQVWPFDFPASVSRSSTFLHQTDVASYSCPPSFYAYQPKQLVIRQIYSNIRHIRQKRLQSAASKLIVVYQIISIFLIKLQGKKAGERMRGYEWEKICMSVWATVGLSAMKVKRKRRECSELWEETQRGITGSHAATEAWCCPDTLREAVTRGQSRTLRNKMWQ